ncbi:MAG: DUF3037 domain-containing protein [Terriglobales bacterium]
MANLSACEYVLIRLAPDPIRGECVNIGVALYEPQAGGFSGVRVNLDLSRARQLSPHFDPADLEDLEADLRTRFRTHSPAWLGREYFLQLAQESFSHCLQISAPTAVLTADPEAELSRLYRELAAPLLAAPAPVKLATAGARRRILLGLRQVFNQERVWDRLRHQVRASEWLGVPDRFRFDHAYQAGGRPHAIQAVELGDHEGPIKELCFTVQQIRRRHGALETVAFAEAMDGAPADVQAYQAELMAAAEIRVLRLSQAVEEASRIRAALGIN